MRNETDYMAEFDRWYNTFKELEPSNPIIDRIINECLESSKPILEPKSLWITQNRTWLSDSKMSYINNQAVVLEVYGVV